MQATITAHPDFVVGPIDPRLYGAFLEHLGRAIYTGIHEPGHPTADAEGMRGDVQALVKALQPPLVRYPGGNFVSAYNWEDGIGPQADRPVRLDLAWHTSESNQVGIHEFAAWCESVGTQMMLAVNLGSRGLDAARDFVQYVNGPLGSHWGDLRAKNGHPEPFGVKLWCLGNEMDGPWQIGHKSAAEYGRLASETAKALRAFDPALELIVCGSSNSDMATYPEWERVVLEQSYESVDHISLHMYFANPAHDTASFLALSEKLDRYIGTVAATIEHVRASKRSQKRVTISFDEWNVWYHSRAQDRAILGGRGGWPHAPRLLEDIYNFEDVLMVGCILNTFIRRADVVKIACIAQLVNVIAPIMTEPGGAAWRQTIYYPLLLASLHGRGTALELRLDCPTYDTAAATGVPWLDVAGVRNSAGEATFFLVNRHGTEALEARIGLDGFAPSGIIADTEIRHADLEAANTREHPDTVVPHEVHDARVEGGTLHVSLPPHAYRMVRVKLG